MSFPGPLSLKLSSIMNQLGVMETRPFAIDLAASQGMYLKTVDGQYIFDWAGYYGSKLLGHNHSCYFEPEYEQRILLAARNRMANPDFVTQELVDYYQFLHAIAPKCMEACNFRVYTLNSGAEAIENALKYCIYKHSLKSKEAPKFLCFEGAFHGRTLYALSLTDMPYDLASTEAFRNAVPTPLRVHFPTNHEQVLRSLDIIEILFQQFPHSLAGLIIEPMLSAGGNLTSTPYFFQQLSELCHNYDIPIIFDEVQTAGGQTGTMWMVDQFDLPHTPDCVVSAKKFGCGVLYMKEPLPEEVLDSTWSGSLVDMVRVPHEFSIVARDKLIERVPEKAAYLLAGLKKLQVKFPEIISTLDGVGLYQGFSLTSVELRRKLITSLLHNYNTLILGAGICSVRVRPPLTVSALDIANFLTKLESALKDL